MSEFKNSLRDFIKAKRRKLKAAREQVINDTREAVSEIILQFPMITNISLAGSVVRGNFSEASDVDIVVAGLTKKDYFKLSNLFERRLGRKIDLILEEDLTVESRRHLFASKEVIYDSKKR